MSPTADDLENSAYGYAAASCNHLPFSRKADKPTSPDNLRIQHLHRARDCKMTRLWRRWWRNYSILYYIN